MLGTYTVVHLTAENAKDKTITHLLKKVKSIMKNIFVINDNNYQLCGGLSE